MSGLALTDRVAEQCDVSQKNPAAKDGGIFIAFFEQ
jgi:hypothetical protein